MKKIKIEITKDIIYGNLIRLWSVGAMYFFVFYGVTNFVNTQSNQYYAIDALITFSIVLTAFLDIIIDPFIRDMFNMNYKRKYNEIPLWERVGKHILNFFLNLLFTYCAIMTYLILVDNTFEFIQWFDIIIISILFTMYYLLFRFVFGVIIPIPTYFNKLLKRDENKL